MQSAGWRYGRRATAITAKANIYTRIAPALRSSAVIHKLSLEHSWPYISLPKFRISLQFYSVMRLISILAGISAIAMTGGAAALPAENSGATCNTKCQKACKRVFNKSGNGPRSQDRAINCSLNCGTKCSAGQSCDVILCAFYLAAG